MYRWKALKPIIVLLEGRLPPWTLWHTFKENGLNVFKPDSQWLWHSPPPVLPAHIALFLSREVNMSELQHSWELLVLKKRNGWARQRDFKGERRTRDFCCQDISCLSHENFGRDTSMETFTLHTTSRAAQLLTCVCWNSCQWFDVCQLLVP